MRNLRLLSTTAAVLLLGAGVAAAQTMNKEEAPARAPTAQQKAPAERTAPAMKPGEQKAGAPQQKAGAQQKETTGQAPKPSDADKTRAGDKGAMDKPAAKSSSDVKASPTGKGSADVKGSADTKSKPAGNAQAPADSKSGQSAAGQKSTTTGQGAAAGSAKLSTEQRTKITTVIKQQKVERIEPSKLNISISVGTRIPSHVHFYTLPQEVIVVYPEWRGYDYILVGNQILIISPSTHEIVAILDA